MTDAERACIAAREAERLAALKCGDRLPAGMGDYIRWEVSYKVQLRFPLWLCVYT